MLARSELASRLSEWRVVNSFKLYHGVLNKAEKIHSGFVLESERKITLMVFDRDNFS